MTLLERGASAAAAHDRAGRRRLQALVGRHDSAEALPIPVDTSGACALPGISTKEPRDEFSRSLRSLEVWEVCNAWKILKAAARDPGHDGLAGLDGSHVSVTHDKETWNLELRKLVAEEHFAADTPEVRYTG